MVVEFCLAKSLASHTGGQRFKGSLTIGQHGNRGKKEKLCTAAPLHFFTQQIEQLDGL